MPTREEYQACLRPYITGKKSKEERKLAFCTGSKICSQKVQTKEEAEHLCRQPKPPHEPKEPSGQRKRRGPNCEKQSERLAHCVAENIDRDMARDINSIEAAIADALKVCQCQGGR